MQVPGRHVSVDDQHRITEKYTLMLPRKACSSDRMCHDWRQNSQMENHDETSMAPIVFDAAIDIPKIRLGINSEFNEEDNSESPHSFNSPDSSIDEDMPTDLHSPRFRTFTTEVFSSEPKKQSLRKKSPIQRPFSTINNSIILSVVNLGCQNPTRASEICGCSRRHIYNVIQCSKSPKPWKPRPKGRASKLTIEHIEFIESQTYLSRRVSTVKLASMLNDHFKAKVSQQTILRAREITGFKFKTPIHSVFLTLGAKNTRIAWCQQKINSSFDWNKVIFSDESYFELCADGRWLGRKMGEDGEDV